MKWSLPDYTEPPDAEEIFNQMSRRNGLVVALVGNSGRVERNGMGESSVVHPHENDVDCNGNSVGCRESDVDGSRRDVNGTVIVTSDVTHSIFQLATLARKKFAQLFQRGRKLDFTPATLLEKPDSDKGNEVEIVDDDKIQLLDSLHMEHGRLTNLEIAFILAIRAITVSSTHIFSTISPFVPAPTSALPSPVALHI